MQANPVSGVRSLSHLEQSAPSREADNGFSHSQVCGHIHTQSTDTLACRQILFQVCGVFHTWNRARPAERPTMAFLTLRCADIFTPRVPTHWLAGKSCFRCAESFTPGTERIQPSGRQWLFSLSGVRTYSHPEYQHIGLQANPVSGVRSLSHLEQSASGREADNGFSHSQVCGHIHTQSTNTLACDLFLNYIARVSIRRLRRYILMFRNGSTGV